MSGRSGPVTLPPKHLFVLRHAKSSWAEPAVPDHDRPLAPRGEEAVARLRRYLAREEVRPALVLCSSAQRTVLTCSGIMPALPAETSVEIEDDLYAAPGPRLLARLRRLEDDVPSVLLIGHNPGVHSLASMVTGAGDPELRGQLATKFPTGAFAALAFGGSWADLAPGSATLEAFVLPRDLP
jgi:phosphohistidine phosphatase